MSKSNVVGRAAQGGDTSADGKQRTKSDQPNGNIPSERADGTEENSQYLSGACFENFRLKKPLLEGLFNYPLEKPSRVQEAVLHVIANEDSADMIVQSHSGSGKTAAFALCMLQKVETKFKLPQCICLTPTYELAVQVGVMVEKIGAFMDDLSVCYAIPDDESSSANRKEPITDQIVVGTPGTLFQWTSQEKRFDLANVKMLVIDEADIMVDLRSLGSQTFAITDALQASCQKLLFSTTITDKTVTFASRVTPNPIVIRLRDDEMYLRNIHQFYMQCRNDDEKFDLTARLCNLIPGQGMIFCMTKRSANVLAEKMRSFGHLVNVITAELTHLERAKRIRDFRHKRYRLLITTNMCSRGIDIPVMVVNYHVPLFPAGSPDFSSYIHRIGRGGRFGLNSIALTFVDNEREMRAIQSIGRRFGKPPQLIEAENLTALAELVRPDLQTN
ncbi:ATP dependent RNA helicase DDX25 [Trichuris trichiura]|uniref:ATP dependent RNA helicase DDX25 n=1 Tax=Trichuris trichiura TaxID=36087 RepID=A0A077Z4Z3_TRITR|nr:ATP dependent RNA helicase DDX25 [Trichuris trichiura]